MTLRAADRSRASRPAPSDVPPSPDEAAARDWREILRDSLTFGGLAAVGLGAGLVWGLGAGLLVLGALAFGLGVWSSTR